MSDSSYINKGNFRYGITEYDQPCIPQYNSTLHHKKHPIREFPHNAIRDDGLPYKEYIPVPACCAGCNKCNAIVRNSLMTSLVNIETSITKVLTVKLYGVTEDLDKTIKMVIGNKYCVTYITEKGTTTVTGRLREISTNIPDECTKYIGNFTSVSTAAWIGLDCSKDGNSDKRLIYIASIRYIEQVFDDGEDHYPDLTLDEKLDNILTKLTSSITTIEEYLNSTENENSDTEESEKPDLPPPPPLPKPPLIGHPHHLYKPYPPFAPYLPKDVAEKLNKPVISMDLLNSMKDIKQLLDSYISEYDNDLRSNICDGCDLGVPMVDNIPYDALPKDLYIVDDGSENNNEEND